MWPRIIMTEGPSTELWSRLASLAEVWRTSLSGGRPVHRLPRLPESAAQLAGSWNASTLDGIASTIHVDPAIIILGMTIIHIVGVLP